RATVGRHRLPDDGEPKAESAAVLTNLNERLEHLFGRAGGEAATSVLDVDGDVAVGFDEAHEDRRSLAAELDGVADQIGQRGADQARVHVDLHAAHAAHFDGDLLFIRGDRRVRQCVGHQVTEGEAPPMQVDALASDRQQEGVLYQVPHALKSTRQNV